MEHGEHIGSDNFENLFPVFISILSHWIYLLLSSFYKSHGLLLYFTKRFVVHKVLFFYKSLALHEAISREKVCVDKNVLQTVLFSDVIQQVWMSAHTYCLYF